MNPREIIPYPENNNLEVSKDYPLAIATDQYSQNVADAIIIEETPKPKKLETEKKLKKLAKKISALQTKIERTIKSDFTMATLELWYQENESYRTELHTILNPAETKHQTSGFRLFGQKDTQSNLKFTDNLQAQSKIDHIKNMLDIAKKYHGIIPSAKLEAFLNSLKDFSYQTYKQQAPELKRHANEHKRNLEYNRLKFQKEICENFFDLKNKTEKEVYKEMDNLSPAGLFSLLDQSRSAIVDIENWKKSHPKNSTDTIKKWHKDLKTKKLQNVINTIEQFYANRNINAKHKPIQAIIKQYHALWAKKENMLSTLKMQKDVTKLESMHLQELYQETMNLMWEIKEWNQTDNQAKSIWRQTKNFVQTKGKTRKRKEALPPALLSVIHTWNTDLSMAMGSLMHDVNIHKQQLNSEATGYKYYTPFKNEKISIPISMFASKKTQRAKQKFFEDYFGTII